MLYPYLDHRACQIIERDTILPRDSVPTDFLRCEFGSIENVTFDAENDVMNFFLDLIDLNFEKIKKRYERNYYFYQPTICYYPKENKWTYEVGLMDKHIFSQMFPEENTPLKKQRPF